MHKKTYSLIILLLSIYVIQAEDISSATQKRVGNIVSLPFGSQAKPEIANYVNSVNTKLDSNVKNVNVKTMNKFAQYLFGYQNAIALPLINVLLVNEAWFNTLPEEQKRFLVGRSLVQMSKPLKYALYKYIIPLLSTIALESISNNKEIKKLQGNIEWEVSWRFNDASTIPNPGLPADIAQWCARQTISWSTFLGLQHLARSLEYEADKQAAEKLNCTQGGINLIERLSTFENDATAIGKAFSTVPMVDIAATTIQNLFMPKKIYFVPGYMVGDGNKVTEFQEDHEIAIGDLTLGHVYPGNTLKYLRNYTPGRLTNQTNRLESFLSNLPLLHYFRSYPRNSDRIKALKEAMKNKVSEKTVTK